MESWMQKCNIFGPFWNKVLAYLKYIFCKYYDINDEEFYNATYFLILL